MTYKKDLEKEIKRMNKLYNKYRGKGNPIAQEYLATKIELENKLERLERSEKDY